MDFNRINKASNHSTNTTLLLSDHFLTMVETVPNTSDNTSSATMDMTHTLLNDGVVGSFNIPLIDDVRERAGYDDEMVDDDPLNNEYYQSPRYHQIHQQSSHVNDIEGMMVLVGYNNPYDIHSRGKLGLCVIGLS